MTGKPCDNINIDEDKPATPCNNINIGKDKPATPCI